MAAETVERVRQGAAEVVRQQPHAHGAWQFSFRNARFRRAIGAFHEALYSLTVEGLPDKALNALIEAVDVVVKIVEVHVSGLGADGYDAIDREYFGPIIRRLQVAREGLEQGMAPDPAKRPSSEQLLDRMASLLREQPLNLPDRTDCAPSGIS